MFCMAVFDMDQGRRSQLHEYLTRYTFEKGMDLDIIWFTDRQAAQKLEKYAEAFCLAFVSLDENQGAQFGIQLSRQNPACRICYYKTTSCDIVPLLKSRPVSFCLWQSVQTNFADMMEKWVLEIEEAVDFFCFPARKEIYHIPIHNIIYFESDLKYVVAHCQKGGDIRLLAKLTEIESRLGRSFVRIHKSYIVNRQYVWGIDKKTHVCQLEIGINLPISEAQYGNAVKSFV